MAWNGGYDEWLSTLDLTLLSNCRVLCKLRLLYKTIHESRPLLLSIRCNLIRRVKHARSVNNPLTAILQEEILISTPSSLAQMLYIILKRFPSNLQKGTITSP